jgi:chorismate dehydratase
MTVRIGAVSYLNTKPLIYGLRQRLAACQLRLDLPSRLADQLVDDQLDVALIPSVEFLRADRLFVVSDACIACRGPVRSVRLLFRTPPSQVKTLALDEGSRTSAVLSQVLLGRRFGLRPRLLPLHIDAKIDAVSADATLIIGDRAMKIEGEKYVDTWDLGEEWSRETGLPFVFAMWVARSERIPSACVDALELSRDEGLKNIESIIAAEAARHGLTVDDCRNYFLRQLYFYLGPQERAGLQLFHQYAMEMALLPTTNKHLNLEAIP